MEPDGNDARDQSQRVLALYDRVDETLKKMRVPEAQRAEIQKNLIEAISADLLVRLGRTLSPEEREQLSNLPRVGDPEHDLAGITAFFKDRFSKDELFDALSSATESVLGDFMKGIGT